MDDEDREEYLRNPEDEEIAENQDNENDTREPGTETRDPLRVPELRRTRRTLTWTRESQQANISGEEMAVG